MRPCFPLALESVDGADLVVGLGNRGLQGGDLGIVGGDDAEVLVGERRLGAVEVDPDDARSDEAADELDDALDLFR